jgi:type I restriction enzyme M protein
MVGVKNKYCTLGSLRNEADVEQNFVRRLLEDFGYSDSEIVPKQSLEALTIGGMRGHPQALYKPDFGLRVKKKVRWIVEAKARTETLDKHAWQPRAYCVLLNGTTKGERPVKYHLLTNGEETRLYDPNLNDPLLILKFSDFVDGAKKFGELRERLKRESILEDSNGNGPTFTLKKVSLSEVNAAFAWCHQHIYRKDDISQAEGFTEFVKLISLKLVSDRRVRDLHPELANEMVFEVPRHEVDFRVGWIEENEQHFANPMNDIRFRNFMVEMERDIDNGVRKRIFEAGDEIRLKPETVRGVVKKLEGIYLFGIDADLNGRLFETFLNATMRGKDLGQFFTPRSLVKLGVGLSQIKVHVRNTDGEYRTDTIADACCGSGGFLIDALADMWRKVDKKNLSGPEKEKLKKRIANTNIVGIDVANAPKLARIARLNMYLHGDGGTRIFHLNALDKELPDAKSDSSETLKEKKELRKLLASHKFDIALTNPPFAKAQERVTDEEKRILDAYELGRSSGRPRAAVRSALLFAERYFDLLRVGGRLVTIIDDGILSSDDNAWFRDKLRKWFLIRAVISLPGDAFQRSNARVKTSYLIAEKRDPEQAQEQPPVFMYPCQHVGIDDQKRQRPRASDAEARRLAEQEIATVLSEYQKFQNGESDKYSVPAERTMDRLDVKYCLMEPGRRISEWRESGFQVLPLSDLVEPRVWSDEEVVKKDSPDNVKLLVVRYEGVAEAGDEILPSETTYATMYPVQENDIVISNIAASYGSMAVVPKELDGCVVSGEYTVLKAKPGFDPVVLQLILRSPEVRADILLSSSGANRTRARWDQFQDLLVPYPKPSLVAKIKDLATEADRAKRQAVKVMKDAEEKLETGLLLRSETASTILAAFRPPK